MHKSRKIISAVLAVILLAGLVPLHVRGAEEEAQEITAPTEAPTAVPTEVPTATPTAAPTTAPTAVPTATPTVAPTEAPTVAPTETPTAASAETPVAVSADAPTETPTAAPIAEPTATPADAPTEAPTPTATEAPAATPTETPAAAPTEVPTATPTPGPIALERRYLLGRVRENLSAGAEVTRETWTSETESKYAAQMRLIRETENVLLTESLRDDSDRPLAFSKEVELYLTCRDWAGTPIKTIEERALAVYVFTAEGQLKKLKTELRRAPDGTPALFFKTKLAGELVLTEEKKAETTAAPEASADPTATATPEVSADPTATPGTDEEQIFFQEEPTDTPEPSEEPTDTPEPSEEPTDTPEPSEEPTDTPEPSEEPTDTPAPSEEPTDTPEPSEEPTDTPEPSEEPTDTPEPSERPTVLRLDGGFALGGALDATTEETVVGSRDWREAEETLYAEQLEELTQSATVRLRVSLRDGDDRPIVLPEGTELYLTRDDWANIGPETLADIAPALYIADGDGTLRKAETDIRRTEDGAAALYFKADMLSDLLLTEPERPTVRTKAPLRAEAPLPSGTTDGIYWEVTDNGNGTYTLVVQPAEGTDTTAIPRKFYSSIRESLGDYAAKLTDLQIGEGLKTANMEAFSQSPFERVTFPAGFENFSGNDYNPQYGAFAQCENLREIVFTDPTSLKSLASGTFYACTALESVDLSRLTITSTGRSVFAACTALKNVKMPSTLTSMGYMLFGDCTALESIDLTNTKLKAVGEYVFSGCTALSDVRLPDTVTTFSAGAFNDCDSLTDIPSVPNLVTIGNKAFASCDGLVSVTLPATVTGKIDERAFTNCHGLTTIDLSQTSVTELANSAFYDCPLLQEVRLPEALTAIGSSTFSGCSSLAQIELPDTVTTIGTYAFYRTALGAVTIPEKVDKIQERAFSECRELTSVELPEGIVSVGSYAFTDSGLEELTIRSKDLSQFPSNSNPQTNPFPPSLMTVTLCENADTIHADYINNVLARGGKAVIRGENDFHAVAGSISAPVEEPLGNMDGDYHVTADGVIYKLNSDGTAALIYCPEGITELTVPETITSVAGDSYRVTELRGHAFSKASDLTTVVFEKPAQVNILVKAFTGSHVQTVNGESAIDPADFAGVSSLCDFPLKKDVGEIATALNSSLMGAPTVDYLTDRKSVV